MHSGDIGYMTENGEIFIIDRVKRIIIRFDGFKVFPSHIEKLIAENKSVIGCCVVGKNDISHKQGKLPLAFISLEENVNKKQIKEDLHQVCKSQLPEYSQPIDFIIMNNLPLTPIGKIDYRKLEDIANKLD